MDTDNHNVHHIFSHWLTYADAIRNPTWRALSFGMLPALISAMCACTWHLFDNPASLEWLVTLQAAMTLIGNITLCLAGWLIWRASKTTQAGITTESTK